jgi:hypothetical protein
MIKFSLMLLFLLGACVIEGLIRKLGGGTFLPQPAPGQPIFDKELGRWIVRGEEIANLARGNSSRQTQYAEKDLGDWAIWLLLSIAALAVIWFLILPESWADPIWYGFKYDVGTDQVHVSAKPSNCDWNWAPMGNKGCHYDRVVTAYGANGAPIPYAMQAPYIQRVEVNWIKVTE